VRQLEESGVPSDGKDGEWYVDIRGSKMVSLHVSIEDRSWCTIERALNFVLTACWIYGVQ
jgi:hypothetical protein